MVPYFTHIYLVLCHFFGDFCQSPAPWKILVFPVTGIYSLLGKRDFTILFFDTNFRAFLHGRGGPQVGEVKCGRSPHLSCKRQVSHLHVNRPLDTSGNMFLDKEINA